MHWAWSDITSAVLDTSVIEEQKQRKRVARSTAAEGGLRNEQGTEGHGRATLGMQSHLSCLPIDPVQDRLEGRVGKATIGNGFLVVFEAGTHAFGSIIKRISERLMDSLKTVATGHKHLHEYGTVSGGNGRTKQ